MNLMEAIFSGIPAVVTQAVRLLLAATFTQYLPYDFTTTTPPAASYDFIVVGAGCAGSVVASRLSELPDVSVLLLEAGKTPPSETAVPILVVLGVGGELDWGIRAIPQRNTHFGYHNNSARLNTARVVGGNTVINGMVYVRGNKEDYNNWARLGNSGWDFDSVLPYFMKSEDFRGTLLPGADGHHGRGGPLRVDSPESDTLLRKAFLEAGQELGYDIVDGAGPQQIGVAPVYTTMKDGVRHSAAESFLKPAADRPNLTITPEAFVTKILFNKKKRAVGVQYVFGGERRIARARKEVIVSAGSLHSSKLLMLSGVGPRKHLQEKRIPIVAAVEGVGRNLQDHPDVYLTWRVNEGTSLNLFDVINPFTVKRYITTRTGPYTLNAGIEAASWFNLGGGDPTWSDVQISVSSLSFAFDRGIILPSTTGLTPQMYQDQYGEFQGDETFTIFLGPARPKSRGSVRLKSSNPFDHPLVDQNFFDHPDDMKLMIKGIRLSFDLVNTAAIQSQLGAQWRREPFRPCAQYGSQSDQYWECYVRTVTNHGWHYSSTCAMGPDSDPMAVVSDRLRVRGVKGLRVIDASIMPQVPTSNTQAPTYMIGEKGADMIKQDWGYPLDPLPVPGA